MNAPLLTGPQPPRMPNADHAGPTRLALWLLGVGFGGFLLWASLAPLDEGVPTPGVVGVTQINAIPLSGGGWSMG